MEVTVSPDGLSAFITIPSGSRAREEDIYRLLREAGVVHGVSRESVARALAGEREVPHLVAKGTVPAQLTGAQAFMWNFAHSQGRPLDTYVVGPEFRSLWGSLRERGTVDPGDVVGYVRHPGALPKAVLVTGKEAPWAAAPKSFQHGRNTQASPDSLRIRATRPGVPYMDDNGIACVLDRVTIRGSVGPGTGSILFPGTLTIQGDVESGFTASAGGDLTITGSVWGSATSRGRITVVGGISAPGEVIDGRLGVTFGFCQNSIVHSQGPITIGQSVLHSVLETDDMVVMESGDGRIAGGVLRATKGLLATIVGTDLGIATEVEVGATPRVRREIKRLTQEARKIEEELLRIERMTPEEPPKGRDMESLRQDRQRRYFDGRRGELLERLAVTNERIAQAPQGIFQARVVHPGTKVTMGTTVHEFKVRTDDVSMGVSEE